MLHVDTNGVFRLEEKRCLFAGAAEISRWLEPDPNPFQPYSNQIGEVCAWVLPGQVPVCSEPYFALLVGPGTGQSDMGEC